MGSSRRRGRRRALAVHAASTTERARPQRPVAIARSPSLSIAAALAIAIGGVAGAGLRWAVLNVVHVGHGFPWPVLAINVIGSALLGALLDLDRLGTHSREALTVGFCGGFTTFSTFAVEVATFLGDGRLGLATAYTTTSAAGSVAAFVVARRVAR